MNGVFSDAKAFNQNLDGWNVSSVTDMSYMFFGAETFNQNIGNWNISNVSNMTWMLNGAALSTPNYNALLSGWSAQILQNNVTFSAGNTAYSNSSQAARDTLTNTFGWTVTDGGNANLK